MADFHFLYPLWLLLIPVWLLLLYGLYRYSGGVSKNWDELVDKALQPFVISGSSGDNERRFLSVVALAGIITLLALSGPSLHKKKVPLFETQQGLVIALDLSRSMLAEDIKPSRIQRAKFALIDLLKQRKSGYTALVVFAGDAFAVAPLTNDNETILAQLKHMTPGIMGDRQGSRLDKAINKAVDLLSHSGYQEGHILLITDGMSNQHVTETAALAAEKKNFDVSILAIGTKDGAAIPASASVAVRQNSKWLLDAQGKVIVAKLDQVALKAVADAGKGIMLSSEQNSKLLDSHIQTLMNRYQLTQVISNNSLTDVKAEHRVNAGIWLVFPVLIFVLMLFHPRMMMSIYVMMGTFCLLCVVPANDAYALDWNSLWNNQQQQAKKILSSDKKSEGALDKLERLPKGTQWDAVVAYRLNKFSQAAELFKTQDSADSWYNRGNALVKIHNLSEAIQAYEKALKKQPGHKDASYNLQLIKQKLQQMANAEPDDNGVLEVSESNIKTNEKEGVNQVSLERYQIQVNRQKELQAYDKQWLKSIPDDPSGLWRRKFKYQYKRLSRQIEAQSW